MQPLNTSRSIRSCTVTNGIVSKVVKVDSLNAMICTDAHVHDGNSGGGIFNKKGELLSLVTSNVKYKLTDKNTGQVQPLILPKINFSIPVDQLEPMFNAVALNKNEKNLKKELQVYNIPNSNLKDVFSFKPVSPLPTVSNTSRRSQMPRVHHTSKL